MHRRATVWTIAVAMVTLCTPLARVSTQDGGLAGARVSHIGISVRDIEKTAREYVRVMGFPMPAINTYPVPTPNGSVEVKLATLTLPNFAIELTQPVKQAGWYHDHLQAHGMSINHVGVVVPGEGSVDELRARLEQNGGRWAVGAKGNAYALVDFQSTVGTTFEVNRANPTQGPMAAMPAGDALPPLAALKVTHVGFAATNRAAATGAYAKAFGAMGPKIIEYKDSQYPPDSKWSREAFLRLAFMNQGGIGMEFIESVGGPTPWSEYVQRLKGTAAQHLAIDVGNRMDEMIRDLTAKGGKWTNGKPGGGYAYLDFMDTLGLIFELNGTSKSAQPAK